MSSGAQMRERQLARLGGMSGRLAWHRWAGAAVQAVKACLACFGMGGPGCQQTGRLCHHGMLHHSSGSGMLHHSSSGLLHHSSSSSGLLHHSSSSSSGLLHHNSLQQSPKMSLKLPRLAWHRWAGAAVQAVQAAAAQSPSLRLSPRPGHSTLGLRLLLMQALLVRAGQKPAAAQSPKLLHRQSSKLPRFAWHLTHQAHQAPRFPGPRHQSHQAPPTRGRRVVRLAHPSCCYQHS